MSTLFYSRLLATTNRLLEKYGQAGAVRRAGVSTGPAHNPTKGAPTDHPAFFAIIEYDAGEIDGTRILATDKKVLMAPGGLGIEPTSTDTLVEANGTAWQIISPVQPLRPAETTLLYTLQIRR